jgi:cytochrome c553
VVEQATVPKSQVGEGNMRFVDPKGGTEPLGRRIIELPQNEEQARARNPRFGFVAYVPKGSIARGAQLAQGGNGKTIACAGCHGEGLKGLGPIPSLAGRSAIFVVRQLMDMQAGRRTGEWTTLHAKVNAKLDTGDIIALAAYSASLKP